MSVQLHRNSEHTSVDLIMVCSKKITLIQANLHCNYSKTLIYQTSSGTEESPVNGESVNQGLTVLTY